jgi:hypothetical protein
VKALELTVYPRRFVETGFARWNGDGTFTPLHVPEWFINGEWNRFPRTEDKRLTDAELAAELFRQTAWLGALGRTYRADEGRNIIIEAAFTFGPVTRDEHEWMTLSHFATLPHYDEKEMNA